MHPNLIKIFYATNHKFYFLKTYQEIDKEEVKNQVILEIDDPSDLTCDDLANMISHLSNLMNHILTPFLPSGVRIEFYKEDYDMVGFQVTYPIIPTWPPAAKE